MKEKKKIKIIHWPITVLIYLVILFGLGWLAAFLIKAFLRIVGVI